MRKKTAKIFMLTGLALVCAFILRFCSTAGHSGGGGRGVDSPNKAFLAEATSFVGEKFWGGKYSSYEFTVKTSTGKLIDHVIMDNPPEPLSDWREDGDKLIQWSPDNSSVTYNFKGGHLTLSVNP